MWCALIQKDTLSYFVWYGEDPKDFVQEKDIKLLATLEANSLEEAMKKVKEWFEKMLLKKNGLLV